MYILKIYLKRIHTALRSRSYPAFALALTLLCLSLPLTGCGNSSAGNIHDEPGSVVRNTSENSNIIYERSLDSDSQKGLKRNPDLYTHHLDIDGVYTSKEDVMNYLIQYGTLPFNFITKKEARMLGWPGGYLDPYAPGKCIGGDRFSNYEGNLPLDFDITYHECDIDTLGKKSRGAKRIVYSDDGRIYYTDDHYNTFTLLYEEGDK